jgi:hypothetical protein
MKTIRYFLLPLIFFASRTFADSNFYTEAGVSYAALHGASYGSAASGFDPTLSLSNIVAGAPAPTSTLTVLSEDKSQWAPFVAAGYTFTDRIGLRLSYQYIGSLSARAKSTIIVGGDAVLGEVSFRFNDKVHVVSLAPVFTWPLASKLTLTFSPEVNWIASRGEILASTDSPQINIAPRQVRNEQDVSVGASVGARWFLTEKCDLILGYKYTDLKPSWGRQAHLFSGGLHWRF